MWISLPYFHSNKESHVLFGTFRQDLGDEGAWPGFRRLLAADFSCRTCCNVSCRRPPSTFSVEGWREDCCIIGDRARSGTSESPILHDLRPQNLQPGFWTSLAEVSKSFSCMSRMLCGKWGEDGDAFAVSHDEIDSGSRIMINIFREVKGSHF